MNTIKDVEIFATGTHNGEKITLKDLQDMVTAFNELDFKPALKPGHVKDETGLPALGYVDNLRIAGHKLIADFVDLPEEIFNSIKNKRFGRVSAEVFYNFQRAGKNFRRALKAVALLGAEIPGVSGLKPLHDMFSATEYEACKTFDYDPSEEMKMEGEELMSRLAAVEAKLADAEQEKKNVEKQFTAQKSEFDEAQSKLKNLQAQLIERDIDEKVKQVRFPAIADHVRALYSVALNESKVVKFSNAEKPLASVIDELVTQVNKVTEKLFTEHTTQEEKQEADVGAEVARRVNEYCVKNSLNPVTNYSVALKAVLSQDAVLKARYAKGE